MTVMRSYDNLMNFDQEMKTNNQLVFSAISWCTGYRDSIRNILWQSKPTL